MYYTIGEFSNIVRVSNKTLRHYETIGLFVPKHIDEITKYRYYTENQIKDILLIIELKKYKFSLKELKEIIPKGDLPTLENALHDKLKETEKQIEQFNHIKQDIKSKIDNLRTKKDVSEIYYNYDFKIKELKDKFVFYKRKIIDIDDLDKLIEVSLEEIKKMGLQYKEPIIAIYHYNNEETDDYNNLDYEDDDYNNMDTEICIEVNRTKYTTDKNKFKVIKGGLYSSKIHVGYLSDSNYDASIEELCKFLIQWTHDKNYRIKGIPIEIMWKKPKLTDNQEESVLEICYPISNNIK